MSDPAPLPSPQDLLQDIPFSLIRRAQFLPRDYVDGFLEVWVTAATDIYALDEFRMSAPAPMRTVAVSERQLLDALGKLYASDERVATEHIMEELPLDMLANELADKPDLLEVDDAAPVIQLVNRIILQALQNRASDIHIEPFEDSIVVRFRVDGVLHEVLYPPKPVQAPLMSRIKVMAGLNIAERRLPQDGSMRVQVGQNEVDVRVSVLPTNHGERLVLRLLNKDAHLSELEELGLSVRQAEWIRQRLAVSHGILLVTGPTGSGKTTTLYSALTAVSSTEKNIITIEDPIEYSLAGVGQIQIHPKVGLSFASGLRSILRQDPDIIMVGEIRDLETAEIAIQASLTGHLVLSTLHTNDSIGAVTRLMDMGIESFLLGSSLNGVMAQRLVRRLCNECKEPFEPPASLLARAPVGIRDHAATRFFKPVGCSQCLQTGYRGRSGVFELLAISEKIRELIDARASAQQIRAAARKEGFTSLWEDGWRQAAQGLTSLEEVLRVTQSEVGAL